MVGLSMGYFRNDGAARFFDFLPDCLPFFCVTRLLCSSNSNTSSAVGFRLSDSPKESRRIACSSGLAGSWESGISSGSQIGDGWADGFCEFAGVSATSAASSSIDAGLRTRLGKLQMIATNQWRFSLMGTTMYGVSNKSFCLVHFLTAS